MQNFASREERGAVDWPNSHPPRLFRRCRQILLRLVLPNSVAMAEHSRFSAVKRGSEPGAPRNKSQSRRKADDIVQTSEDTPPEQKDLKQDPGIGRTKGIRGPSDYEALKRGNTIEGDVANDTTAQGGANPDQRGRTNK